MRREFLTQMAALTAAAAAPSVFAQGAPASDKIIRMLVPFAAGGTADLPMRLIQPKMSEFLGQPIVIENRLGGTTSVAATAVTKSPPDGSMLMFTAANTHLIHTIDRPSIPYDPVKDFTPIAGVTRSGYVMVVHPSIPANNIAEFVAYCKANPDKVSFASSGVGNADHLSFERFNLATGIKTTHIPYKAATTAVIDLLEGRVQAYFTATSLLESYVKAGRLRALAYSGTQQGDVPPSLTFTAAGLPEFEQVDSIYVILGPANMAPALVARLQGAVERTLAIPEIRTSLLGMNQYAYFMTSAQLGDRMRNGLGAYRQIIKSANIKLDS